MAFRGIYPPPELIPAPCGVLSVARVTEYTARNYDERWVRGFSFEYDSTPTTLELLTTNDASVTGGELYDGSSDERYADYYPFHIEVEDLHSTFGLPGEDRFDRVKKQLEVATQKALELELWDGPAAKAEFTTNPYLSKTGGATEAAATGAYPAAEALFHLEQALANSPVGAAGVIHMTRDVASILGSRLVFVEDKDGKPSKAMTRLGTEVIIGMGYSGNGPVGTTNAAASASNRWMYGTGPVDVHLGKVEVINEDLGQGVNASINDMRIKAYRPAAVYFDPSVHYTVRVAVPTL